MHPESLVLLILALCGFGVFLSLILPDRFNRTVLALIGMLEAAAMLMAGAGLLLRGMSFHLSLWQFPTLGTLSIEGDALSGVFLSVTAIVLFAASLYATGQIKKYLGRYSIRRLAIYLHLLTASIVLILTAADALLFLLSWETMSILSYLLVNYEYEKKETPKAGLHMLAMSEVGTMAVAIAFLLLAKGGGGFEFSAMKATSAALSPAVRWTTFLLVFFGFGVKAGLFPVNSWLPRAYGVAPNVFTAILAGITLNLGIYGIIRLFPGLMPMNTPWPGLLMLITGSISAILGILYATKENNLKVLLAHSSIENAGIVIAAWGAGLVFLAQGHRIIAGMAFITSLYHMANHSLYKGLLFLGAGSVESGSGELDLDRLGGLIRRMPWTALFFLAGSLSIAALPPFNGFVSEWLTLQTLLQAPAINSLEIKVAFALCGAVLALTAGLAVTCFVKAFSMAFLGTARSGRARKAAEVPFTMRAPMGVLAFLCLLMGILPTYVIPTLDRAVSPMVHESVTQALVPPFFTPKETHEKLPENFIADFHDLGAQVGKDVLPGRGLVVLHRGGKKNPVVFAMSTSYTLAVLLLLLAGTYLAAKALSTGRVVRKRTAWDGGLRRLFSRMTYTATGFSNPVRVIFEAVFHPTETEDVKGESVVRHFRTAIIRERRETHIVERIFLVPVVSAMRSLSTLFARMHRGRVNLYAGYVLMCLVLALIFIKTLEILQ